MTTPPTPSQTTLEETLPRAVRFLGATGTRPAIRRQLEVIGYTEEEHTRGWSLVHAATGFNPQAHAAPPTELPTARIAMNELDASDDLWLRQIKASLRFSHPEAAQRLLAGLNPATGPGAVVNAIALADRIATLRESGDQDAAQKLARRGFDEAWIERTRALAAEAQRLDLTQTPDDNAAQEAQREALILLHAWYREWADLARTCIKRRDWLISLGLTSRRTTAPKTDEDEDA